MVASYLNDKVYVFQDSLRVFKFMHRPHKLLFNMQMAVHNDQVAILDIDQGDQVIIFESCEEYIIPRAKGLAFLSDGRLLITDPDKKQVFFYQRNHQGSRLPVTFRDPSLIYVSPTDQIYILDGKEIILVPIENEVYMCANLQRFDVSCFEVVTGITTDKDHSLWACGKQKDGEWKLVKF